MGSHTSLTTQRITTQTLSTEGQSEFEKFETLARNLVRVPKEEIDAEREAGSA